MAEILNDWTIYCTWNDPADGRAGPGDAGDDDEPKALVLQPAHGHVVRVPVPVTLCKIQGWTIFIQNSVLYHNSFNC